MPERIFADTNLFLRYLTNDVPAQADAVERLLRRAAAGEIALVANNMVVAEIIWVLESYYRLPREDVRTKVLALLNTHGLEIVERDLILRAVNWWAEENVDYVDAYNAAWLLAHGMVEICAFDRRHFARLSGVTVCTPGQGE